MKRVGRSRLIGSLVILAWMHLILASANLAIADQVLGSLVYTSPSACSVGYSGISSSLNANITLIGGCTNNAVSFSYVGISSIKNVGSPITGNFVSYRSLQLAYANPTTASVSLSTTITNCASLPASISTPTWSSSPSCSNCLSSALTVLNLTGLEEISISSCN